MEGNRESWLAAVLIKRVGASAKNTPAKWLITLTLVPEAFGKSAILLGHPRPVCDFFIIALHQHTVSHVHSYPPFLGYVAVHRLDYVAVHD